LARLAGNEHPGLRESIASTSAWLIEHRLNDEWGITWPTAIPYECACSPQQWESLPPSRNAWCYGAAGIARALWLASQALNEDRMAEIALASVKAILRRPFSARLIDAPILCHGHAGLL